MLAAFTCFDCFMLLELDTMVDINTSPLCSELFVIKIPFLKFFLKKKKLNLLLWWLEFSLKNLEFSIKNFISLLLNTFMIYGFYSLGGEIYFKSELMVDFFLSWCEIWLVYLWSCSLRYGFLSYWISLRNIGKDLRKTQVKFWKWGIDWRQFSFLVLIFVQKWVE